jgi:hypothetical protein
VTVIADAASDPTSPEMRAALCVTRFADAGIRAAADQKPVSG